MYLIQLLLWADVCNFKGRLARTNQPAEQTQDIMYKQIMGRKQTKLRPVYTPSQASSGLYPERHERQVNEAAPKKSKHSTGLMGSEEVVPLTILMVAALQHNSLSRL